jgi:hypothetical protein
MAMFTLIGCSSMNEKQCHTADWRLIGYEDGLAGHSSLQLKQHREACAKHGISPDLDQYLTGHREGLVVYCRPTKAFNLGRAGQSYPGICPTEMEDSLRPAYRDGAKVYKYHSKVQKVQQRLTAKRNQFEQNKQTLSEYQKELISQGTSKQRRLEILADSVSLSKQQDQLEDEIFVLKDKLRIRKGELKRLEARLEY